MAGSRPAAFSSDRKTHNGRPSVLLWRLECFVLLKSAMFFPSSSISLIGLRQSSEVTAMAILLGVSWYCTFMSSDSWELHAPSDTQGFDVTNSKMGSIYSVHKIMNPSIKIFSFSDQVFIRFYSSDTSVHFMFIFIRSSFRNNKKLQT